jgi:predicted metal-dependent hydrolase
MKRIDRQSGSAALRILEPQFVEYGTTTIPYVVTRTDRKRVSIEVLPRLIVIVSAPRSATAEAIRAAVQSKGSWILRQCRYFADLLPHTPQRRFVSGESHLYLGRKYRLRIREANGPERVTLDSGQLHIYTNAIDSLDAKRALLAGWYRRHAERVLPERVEACTTHPLLRESRPSEIRIRMLAKRWGSCSPQGRLSLNVDLIRAPRGCIDYVITHELCHLIVPNHSLKFTRLLDRIMPDWRERKQQLERRLA